MKLTSRIALGFLILWTYSVYSEVRISITQGISSARPIAVVQFTGITSEDNNISSIVVEDLRNSGKFNPIEKIPISAKHLNFEDITIFDWSALGINEVVIGQVQPSIDGRYLISYQLVDTSGTVKKILAENHYKITKQWLRQTAHNISDEIFEKLTGIKGAFRTRIAYIVQYNNKKLPYELRVSDYDGYNQFIIHRSPEPMMSPAWSPDGTKIAYVNFESGQSALVIQTLANSVIRKISAFPRHNGAPAFSPDSSKLAFVLSKSGSLNIYLMELTSGHITQITDNRSNNTEPSWFPDSKNLAYTSDQDGRPQIFKININKRVPERVTWQGDQNQDVEISHDGKFMVLVAINNGNQHLVKQDFKSGAVQVLTDSFLDETPSISPNGIMIIYSSTKIGTGSVLQLISTDGRFKSNLMSSGGGKFTFPAWSPYL